MSNTQLTEPIVTGPDTLWQAWRRALNDNPNLARAIELKNQLQGVLYRIAVLQQQAAQLEEELQPLVLALSDEERRVLS